MILTIININTTIIAFKAKKAFTSVVSEMVYTSGIILAGIEFLGTEGNLSFTVFAHEAWLTSTLVCLHLVDACCIVLTVVVDAIVNVWFTSRTWESWCTFTTKNEKSIFKDCNISLINFFWVSIFFTISIVEDRRNKISLGCTVN